MAVILPASQASESDEQGGGDREPATRKVAEPSLIARLLHIFATQGTQTCVLPSLSCVVRPLTVGHWGSHVHLLIFDVLPGASAPDKLVLKHSPAQAKSASREALSYAAITPLIDPSTAVFPRVWGCYLGPLGEAMLLEAVEERVPERVADLLESAHDIMEEEVPLIQHPPLAAKAPPVDPLKQPLPPECQPVAAAEHDKDSGSESASSPASSRPTSPIFEDLSHLLDLPMYTAEDCKLALRAIARFHAPFLGNNDLLQTLAVAHPFLVSDFSYAASSPLLHASDAAQLKRRYEALPLDMLPAEKREWLFALVKDAPGWRATCGSLLPRTLLHGDCQTGNILIRSSPTSGKQDEVVFIDPNFAIGPPTLDLSFFLTALWASYGGAPPIDAAQALETYLAELAKLGVDWLRTEDDAELEQKAELLGRCVQLEAAVTILWRTIDFLERMPEVAGARIDSVLGHLRELEPRCRETMARLNGAESPKKAEAADAEVVQTVQG